MVGVVGPDPELLGQEWSGSVGVPGAAAQYEGEEQPNSDQLWGGSLLLGVVMPLNTAPAETQTHTIYDICKL